MCKAKDKQEWLRELRERALKERPATRVAKFSTRLQRVFRGIGDRRQLAQLLASMPRGPDGKVDTDDLLVAAASYLAGEDGSSEAPRAAAPPPDVPLDVALDVVIRHVVRALEQRLR